MQAARTWVGEYGPPARPRLWRVGPSVTRALGAAPPWGWGCSGGFFAPHALEKSRARGAGCPMAAASRPPSSRDGVWEACPLCPRPEASEGAAHVCLPMEGPGRPRQSECLFIDWPGAAESQRRGVRQPDPDQEPRTVSLLRGCVGVGWASASPRVPAGVGHSSVEAGAGVQCCSVCVCVCVSWGRVWTVGAPPDVSVLGAHRPGPTCLPAAFAHLARRCGRVFARDTGSSGFEARP